MDAAPQRLRVEKGAVHRSRFTLRGRLKLESIPMPKSLEELQSLAKRVRREIIVTIGAAKTGHPGGSLSAVEIVIEPYFDFMHIDPKNPKWPAAPGVAGRVRPDGLQHRGCGKKSDGPQALMRGARGAL